MEVYSAKRGWSKRRQWRWRATAKNGKVLAVGSESYANRADLLKALRLLFDAEVENRPEDAGDVAG